MDIISMVFQVVTVVSAFYVVFLIFRKNFEYIGNKLFIVSFFLFGTYALVLFLYEFPISILVNEILLNLSLYLVVIGVLFFVLSMQTFTQGSMFLKGLTTRILILITIIICIILAFFPYKVLQVSPNIEANKNIISLLATGVLSLGFMIYNLILLYIALSRINKSETFIRKKIKVLAIAQIIGLMSPIMSVIGNILKNDIIHGLMFIFLAIAMVIVGFLIKQKEKIP
ncbi:MAG: hypothetical protein EU541_00660 [Promethearchaeota archaeon]|nr:MAG: hypothetical protein EU541_00660 [Candidatus Lokiarchaeota archaeon]